MTRARPAALLGVLLLAGCAGVPGEPPAITVLAAASLQGALDELAAAFEEEHGVTVTLVYDGSSTLVTQLLEGATADVLATADEATMAAVVEAGLIDGTPEPFATNTLRIAVHPDNPHAVAGLADLAEILADGLRVAVCAPQVPCGAAAGEVLAAAGVTLPGASEEQSVSAVLTKIVQDEVDAGLVYATDIDRARGAVLGVDFPESARAVNTYPIAVLVGATAVARDFADLVASPEGRAVLVAHGFGEP